MIRLIAFATMLVSICSAVAAAELNYGSRAHLRGVP